MLEKLLQVIYFKLSNNYFLQLTKLGAKIGRKVVGILRIKEKPAANNWLQARESLTQAENFTFNFPAPSLFAGTRGLRFDTTKSTAGSSL